MAIRDLLTTAHAAIAQALAELEVNPPPGPVGEPRLVFALEWDDSNGVPQRRVLGSITLAEAQAAIR